jgi:lipopolysaccharide/colanic/teichoic acid biosynthesis glycosyltransferase
MRAGATERAPRAGVGGAAARRALDLVLAACALALLALPMLVVALLIRLDSPGPALFRQRRIGRDRTPFTLLKFRTMRVGTSDAPLRALIARELAGEDASSHGSWKLPSDARVTRAGAVLRRTSLVELP